jgi:hypothetical protein
MKQKYTFDEEKIVYEILDEEVVLVNLDNGHYYVLDGTAAVIWQYIVSGLSIEETAGFLLEYYTADQEKIVTVLEDFVGDLVQEQLLENLDSSSVKATPPQFPEIQPPDSPKRFEMPAMYKYTDMANLIQMDPIREYDETGWPKKRTFPKPTEE